jgi:hypothetical protein
MGQRFILALTSVTFIALAIPSLASAASLSNAQASAIVGLLQAFGADQSIVLQVEQALGIAPVTTTNPTTTSTSTSTPPVHVAVVGNFYKSSNLGFDYSYNAPLFPPSNFGFGLVGVSGGKSFTKNPRINQEFTWAKFGAGAAPTLYMNLNAPYGSSVTGNVSSPETCTMTTVGTTTDPTACAGYNYGYNAAAYAFSYAQTSGVSSTLWWLDIEEANSWSPDPSVNDAVIQGAIDYLNKQGIRVGIYSIPYMWNDIAGSTFVPTQKINGQSVSIPNWLPIGITNQIGATNACVTETGFITGSPLWLVQYETSSTAVDQNYSC